MHALDDAGPEDLLQELHRLLLGDVLTKVWVLLEALVQPVDGLGAAEAVLDHRLHADPVSLARHARVERADDLVPEPGGAPGAADHVGVRHASRRTLDRYRAISKSQLVAVSWLICRRVKGNSWFFFGGADDGTDGPALHFETSVTDVDATGFLKDLKRYNFWKSIFHFSRLHVFFDITF